LKQKAGEQLFDLIIPVPIPPTQPCNINKAFGPHYLKNVKNMPSGIFLLGKKQNVYQKDIEQEFNIRRATASELLQKLENASYIIRLNDPDDKRLKRIEITKKGEMHVNKIQERIQKMETILCDQIQKEDLDVFFQVITQMYKNCKSVQQDKKGEIS